MIGHVVVVCKYWKTTETCRRFGGIGKKRLFKQFEMGRWAVGNLTVELGCSV